MLNIHNQTNSQIISYALKDAQTHTHIQTHTPLQLHFKHPKWWKIKHSKTWIFTSTCIWKLFLYSGICLFSCLLLNAQPSTVAQYLLLLTWTDNNCRLSCLFLSYLKGTLLMITCPCRIYFAVFCDWAGAKKFWSRHSHCADFVDASNILFSKHSCPKLSVIFIIFITIFLHYFLFCCILSFAFALEFKKKILFW